MASQQQQMMPRWRTCRTRDKILPQMRLGQTNHIWGNILLRGAVGLHLGYEHTSPRRHCAFDGECAILVGFE